QLITHLQSVISRSLDPLDGGVLSITQFHSGTAFNVIPETAQLAGTLRCLNMDTQRLACARIKEVAEGLALANRAQIKVTLTEGYPVTKNHVAQAQFAQTIAREIVGDAHVDGQMPPSMSAEDFAFMLEARPGAFLYIGNGESAGLHHPKYDFNDEVLAYGMTFWARLVERRPSLS
ncbi:MAG: M20/M25/M40 family metallo-hydrolase, partial [Alphaproteobacteria bacterium]|nr:M20/M25/M40 family metallo-hydrolase [Alphaproteobacteria bacterium]